MEIFCHLYSIQMKEEITERERHRWQWQERSSRWVINQDDGNWELTSLILTKNGYTTQGVEGTWCHTRKLSGAVNLRYQRPDYFLWRVMVRWKRQHVYRQDYQLEEVMTRLKFFRTWCQKNHRQRCRQALTREQQGLVNFGCRGKLDRLFSRCQAK